MKDTVFVFGAGCSYNAGIPLLKDFVQTMWDIAIKGKYKEYSLTNDDREIFLNALKVRDEIDSYHGRANFDDRNIEDILSILSFNLYEGKKIDKDRLAYIIKAIERTIEITCTVKHDGNFGTIQNEGDDIYRTFWKSILNKRELNYEIPTIITFNYDLVLERSLFQFLNRTIEGGPFPLFKDQKINVRYYYDHLDGVSYNVKRTQYGTPFDNNGLGIVLEDTPYDPETGSTIEILKLHGSLNFPETKTQITSLAFNANNPFILPPVYNKTNTNKGKMIWKTALDRLRHAKNIIFVGYSLPQTDIYMQYFLKSSFGPNIDLNKLFVFDPIIGRNENKGASFKERFRRCFNEQFYNRIEFIPDSFNSPRDQGSFFHFVTMLNSDPSPLLF